MADRLDGNAADLAEALQKTIQCCSLWIAFRLTRKRRRVSLKAERCCTGHIPNATGKVRKVTAFMKAAILLDERSFAFQAGLLIACVVMRLDPIRDLVPITNDFSNHIAFEGIGFADWVMSTGLSLVFQCPPIEALSDIEWSPIWAAQYIDVVPP